MNRRRGKSSVLALSACLALLAGACGGGSEVEPETPATQDQTDAAEGQTDATEGQTDSLTEASADLVEVDITISTHPLLDFSVPVLVGIEQGFFEEEGLQIASVVGSEGGGTTVRNILTGGLEFGLVSFPAAIQANIAGAPLPAISAMAGEVTSHSLVVAEDSEIDSLQEAVEQGVTIGFTSPGSVTEALAALTLEREGFNPEEVDLRPTGGMGAGFTSAKEGGFGVVSAIEPIFSLAGEGLRIIHEISESVPEYQQMVWVASPSFMEEHPELVTGFLRARQRSIDWIANNMEDAAELWANEADIDVEVALNSLQIVADKVGIDEYYGNGFKADPIGVTVKSMLALGAITEEDVIPWEEIIIQDFLPEGGTTVDVGQLPNPEPEE